MKISQKGIDLIKKYEGCRLTAYLCPANVWTIGYGHTKGVKKGQVITQSQAEELLKQDLVKFESAVEAYVKVEINQNQFDALVSFAYNCGTGALKTSTLLKKLNAGNYIGAVNEFSRWNKGGGKVLEGLVRRRSEEKTLFLSGTSSTVIERDRSIIALQTVIGANPDGIPGPETLSKCPTLRRGDRTDVVAWVQAKLGITADGIFGINTLNTIFKFQRENDLETDGIFGQKSWRKLLGLL